MKRKNSPYKDLLFLSISSFVVVAAWIGFNLYHSWVTTTITPELQITIKPINPNFDMAVIEKLKSRNTVAPVTSLINKTTTPTPTTAPDTGVPNRPSTDPNPEISPQAQLSPTTSPTEILLGE